MVKYIKELISSMPMASETTKTPSIIARFVQAFTDSPTAQKVADVVSDAVSTNTMLSGISAAVGEIARSATSGQNIGNMSQPDITQLGVMPSPREVPGPTPQALAARAQQNGKALT